MEKKPVRYGEEYLGTEIIETEDMMCKDCVHRLEPSGVCKKYSSKPLKVFDKNECDYYEQEK